MEEEDESAPNKGQSQPAVDDAVSNSTGFKPTRRVREGPGGKGSLGKAFWGDEAEPVEETFKPSRRCVPEGTPVGHSVLDCPLSRVRENPGGTGNGPVSCPIELPHLPKLTRSLPSSSKVLGMEQGESGYANGVDPQL